MLPRIIGTVKTAFLRLDDRINAVGIGAGNRDTDLAQDSLRETVTLQMFPRNAIVFRSVESTSWTAAGKKPRLPSGLPQGCENNVRIVGIKNNIDPACIFVFGHNFRPRLPAVGGPKYSAFCVRTERMTKRRYEDDILISWIDN